MTFKFLSLQFFLNTHMCGFDIFNELCVSSNAAKHPVERGFNELREICHQWKKQLAQADDGLEKLDAWVQDLLVELQHVQCSVSAEICENINIVLSS